MATNAYNRYIYIYMYICIPLPIGSMDGMGYLIIIDVIFQYYYLRAISFVAGQYTENVVALRMARKAGL